MNYAIIAAGEGSRLAQEGVSLPKPLVHLNGTPMIKRLIDIMMQCNPESLSIIVNEQMTEVREYIEGLTLPVPLHLVVKSTPSSMHSFWEVSRAFPATGKFVLTTVDTIFREDEFRDYVEAFEASDDADGYMAVTSFIDDEKPLYIDVDDRMWITAFRDAPFDGVKYISGGVYGLTPPALGVPLLVSAIAVEESQVLMLNAHRVLQTCTSACDFHRRLVENLVGILAKKNLTLTRKIDQISKKTIRGKVLAYLSSEAGQQDSNDITVPFNRQQLAEYLAVDRSALSAELSRMQKEGIISYRKNHFVLNKDHIE